MDYFPEGVLNSEQLRALQARCVIQSPVVLDAKGSAFDLHLATRGWILNGSIKQIAEHKETVPAVCSRYGAPFKLDKRGHSLRKGEVAVVELEERVDFSQHPWLLGEATGKSSIGRLDILTRLLVNGCPEYECVPMKYSGPMYVEIAPISFDIRIYPRSSLNQLRIHCGERAPLSSLVGRRLLFQSHSGKKFSADAQTNRTLSLDISPRNLAAYVLRRDKLDLLDFKRKKTLDARKYFEAVEGKGGSLQLEVDRFYILKSRERLVLPEDIGVTGMAYSENLGELRIHYAGFAHPWFGMDRQDGRIGTPLIFEVRAHSFPIVLRHGEVFAMIKFYKMSLPIPETDKDQEADDYTNQELKLSNFFAAGTEPTKAKRSARRSTR
jgi:dCTP deaminase